MCGPGKSKHCTTNMAATLVAVVFALPEQRSEALPPVLAVCCQWRVAIFLHVLSNHLPNCLFLEGNITEKRLVLMVQRNKKQCFIVSKYILIFSSAGGARLNQQRLSRCPPSWIFIHRMEWRSVYSRIWMRNKGRHAFHILAVFIPELWIKKGPIS